MRPSTTYTVTLCVSLLLFACGKSGDKPADKPAADKAAAPAEAAAPTPGAPAAPAPAPDASAGFCEVTISGDVTDTIKSGGGPQAVGTDYWMAPEDLEGAVRSMVNVTAPKGEDREKAFQEAMTKDPKLFILLVNCIGEKSSLTIGPAQGSKYADVPFGPGKYKFASGGDAKPGDMTAMWTHDNNMVGDLSGELNIIQWDKKKIVADITLHGVQKDFATKAEKKLSARGKLELPCHGSKICEP